MLKTQSESINISVLIAIHNSEKYLGKCLDSVCAQSLKEIEIICIDGGSADRSPEILADYQRKDPRIKIINDLNTSFGHKINVGIKQACGKYIGILDSDDCMKDNMLEKLYVIAEKYMADYVDSDYDTFFELNERMYSYDIKKYGVLDYYDRILTTEENINVLQSGSSGAIWTGIYNRCFLLENNIFMFESPGASYQDTTFRFLVNILAKSSYHVPQYLYRYRSDNSESSIKDIKKIYTISEEYEYLRRQLELRKIKDKTIWGFYYLWKYSSYYWNTFRLPGRAREEFLIKYQEDLKEDIQTGFLYKEQMTHMEYLNTYMLLENRDLFMTYIDKDAQYGNLSYKRISGMIKEIGNRNIVIFGCGIYGSQVKRLFQDCPEQIYCFCDNKKRIQYSNFEEYRILPVAEAVKKFPDAVFVIAPLKYKEEMTEQLLKENVSFDRICISSL